MEKSKFIAIVSKYETFEKTGDSWNTEFFSEKVTEKNFKDICFMVKWEIGGHSGGSCWGGEAKPFFTSDPEKEFDDLDEILQKVVPNITFLQYRILLKKLDIQYDEHRVGDYYGNDTIYKRKFFHIARLYELLKEFV
jgi:hypothetical protein